MSDQLPPPPSYPPPPPYPAPPPHPPAPRRRRRGPLLAAVLGGLTALLVVGLAVAVPLVRDDRREDVAREASLDDVRIYHGMDTTHREGEIDYPVSPSVGGPHAPTWLDCGVYDEPVREEMVVHDLEHGTVWITYDPDLSGEDVDRLVGALPDNGILSPYPGLAAPVVVTVWGRQLELDGADDPRLALFIEAWLGAVSAPEPFASCAGGLRNPGSGTEV